MNARPDYTALDHALLRVIGERRPGQKFSAICQAVQVIAAPLATPSIRGDDTTWRVVDRRLQALRKAGKIKPIRFGGAPYWALA